MGEFTGFPCFISRAGDFTSLLNNREKAVIVWLTIFFGWALTKPEFQSSIIKVIRASLRATILLILFALGLYVALLIYSGHKFHLWIPSMAKDTAIWFFFTALVLVINSAQANEDEVFFRKVLFDSFRIVVAFDFISNLYTFNMLSEMFLVPFLVLLVGISALSGRDKNLACIKPFAEWILAIVGLVLLVATFKSVVSDFKSFATFENLRDFLLPPALTISLIPFIYLSALLIAYEYLFEMEIDDCYPDNKELATILKKRVFFTCLLRLEKVNYFAKTFRSRNGENQSDIARVMSEFESDWKTRKG